MGKGSKKFIDKSKSLTFQVVHRSQRDPAMADMDASKLVLKPVAPSYNLLKKGKVLDMPEVDYEFEEVESDEEEEEDLDAYLNGDYADESEDDLSEDYEDYEEGEEEEAVETVNLVQERKQQAEAAHAAAVAALQAAPTLAESAKAAGKRTVAPEKDVSVFGIFFKDQKEYDYTQHLKPMGEDPNAVFIDSKAEQERRKAEQKHKGGIKFMDDAASVAMSEVPRRKVAFNIPTEVLGSEYEDKIGMLNRGETVKVIDVEPSMRETIYALEDEAYVEEDIDDFFDALNADDVPEELKQKLDPEDYYPDQQDDDDDEEGEGDWYDEYQRYKAQGGDSDDEYDDEDDGSYIERRTAMSALSMTSSAMVRTKHLTNLDDQFDQALKAYDDDQIGDLEGETYDPETLEPVSLDPHVPTVSAARMNKIFDTFLESTEVVGRKGLVLNKVPESVKIDAIRNDLRDVTHVTEEMKLSVDDTIEGGDALVEELEKEFQEMYPARDENKWDVETVLTTYSNIYNHPKMIRDVMSNTRKIKLSRKGPVALEPQPAVSDVVEEEEEDEESEGEFGVNTGKARVKGETKEEKKARKQAIKDQKKERRQEKKTTKDAFKKEISHQQKAALNKSAQGIFVPI
ncbi:UNVERIFIED_CONTAM: glycerol ethanol, ferric requiring protein [Siphonaria sp. JEL0065]|nr:glycerol ethanol, ferric requiring protein [Siphonaria sp. JEL0065]